MDTLYQWRELLDRQIQELDVIQWTVLIFGVIQVLLARVNNILLYPAGLVATVLSVFSFYQAGLYAESLLNLYYVVMSLYGWWHWRTPKGRNSVPVASASTRDWAITGVIVFGGWAVLAMALSRFTPSDVPLWDAWISSTAWAGMWLLAKRRTENWLLLNVSNAFAVPLLFIKGLPLFAILTIVLFIVACKGYVDWRAMETSKRDKPVSDPL